MDNLPNHDYFNRMRPPKCKLEHCDSCILQKKEWVCDPNVPKKNIQVGGTLQQVDKHITKTKTNKLKYDWIDGLRIR